MKKMKKKLLLILIIFFCSLLAGCYNNLTKEQKIEKIIKKMTIEQKIAQMLIVYYNSKKYDETLSSVVKNINPGGFIVFSDNIYSDEQLSNFVKDMQKESKIKMFISIDQEGGLVQRLKPINDIKAHTIKNMADVSSEEEAYEIGKTIGKDLSNYGFNVDFAPVVDVGDENSTIGNRSFGNDYNNVSKMGLSVAKGMQENNVIPVFKHFPGLGSTTLDSHYDLPILNKTKEELYQQELVPFINAINNGANIIMVGHIAIPSISGDNTPASLSKKVITELLKTELKFKGLVVTDALNMGALTNYYSKSEIIINTINAGTDLLLMPGSSSETISIIKNAINNGKIKEERIENSVRAILKLKYKFNIIK